jgi:hypothetical protein
VRQAVLLDGGVEVDAAAGMSIGPGAMQLIRTDGALRGCGPGPVDELPTD